MSSIPVINVKIESNLQAGYAATYALTSTVSGEPAMGLYLTGNALNSSSGNEWVKTMSFNIISPITMSYSFQWVTISGSTFRIQVYKSSTGEKVLDKVSADTGSPWTIPSILPSDSYTFYLTNLTGVLNPDTIWARIKGYAIATTAQTDVNISAVSAGAIVPFFDNTVVAPTTGFATTTFTNQNFSPNTNYIISWVNSAATAAGTSLVEISEANSIFNNVTKFYDAFIIGDKINFIISTGPIGGEFTGTMVCKCVSGGVPGSSTLVRLQGTKC